MISSEEPLFYSRHNIQGTSPVACTVHIKQHSSLRSVLEIFVQASVNISSKIRVVLAGNVKQIAHQMIKYEGNLFISQKWRINKLVLNPFSPELGR